MDPHRRFAPELPNVHEARQFVRQNLGHSGADPDIAALLTSELATNAVVHTSSPFVVNVRSEPGNLHVEIQNDEPELLLSMRTADSADATSGRGLRIVEAFARRWGTESSRDHKVVWFDLGPPSST
jgi:anti-sigma regulatory factor (Ser/Thr protein kinase)